VSYTFYPPVCLHGIDWESLPLHNNIYHIFTWSKKMEYSSCGSSHVTVGTLCIQFLKTKRLETNIVTMHHNVQVVCKSISMALNTETSHNISQVDYM